MCHWMLPKVRAGASVECSRVYVMLFKDAVVIFGPEWKGSLPGGAGRFQETMVQSDACGRSLIR